MRREMGLTWKERDHDYQREMELTKKEGNTNCSRKLNCQRRKYSFKKKGNEK